MTDTQRPFADDEAPLHTGTLIVRWSMDDTMITARPRYTCPCTMVPDLTEFNADIAEALWDVALKEDRDGAGFADDEVSACVYVTLPHSPVDARTALLIGSRLSELTQFDGLTVVVVEEDLSDKYFPPGQ